MTKKNPPEKTSRRLRKCPTGIKGLDEITDGGLPAGRSTLVCGGAGSGKTLLALEFIINGARDLGEPGVFVAFEETVQELAENISSLGYDLNDLMDRKKVAVDYIYIERSEYQETGEFDLDGLFIRLGDLIDTIGARRVALDSTEVLFSGLPNPAIIRAEMRRLIRWLKEKGVTVIITGEQGENTLSRHGLEEYVNDCVILLDHRVINQIATRRLRVMKYRGSGHGTNEFPTIIDGSGLSILPITSLGLDYEGTEERISTGIAKLDAMMGGKGFFKGSSVLVSGTAGSGKSSIAAAFTDGICRNGGKCLYYSFEESPSQITRNMRSIGFDLGSHVRNGRLMIHAIRPTLYGLEKHLLELYRYFEEFRPNAVIMDPVTNLIAAGNLYDTTIMLTRLIDLLKNRQITAMFTSLTENSNAAEQSEVGISSLMDTWVLLRMIESEGTRKRNLYILKSRGMAHSNRTLEFTLSDRGIDIMYDSTVSGPRAMTGNSAPAEDGGETQGRTMQSRSVEDNQ